jgi:hypothetical protein
LGTRVEIKIPIIDIHTRWLFIDFSFHVNSRLNFCQEKHQRFHEKKLNLLSL